MKTESERVNPCTPYFCNVATGNEFSAPVETNPFHVPGAERYRGARSLPVTPSVGAGS